ncbi:uncharacterized protein KRP23_8382 [Phytophthora ramorum]|uniref:uncharacterized protein n=1 Tax=Phytophthora ramorum TaxID=164328 RepID=UPI0030A6A066|nr:hypothetical protein KRP23_8382 [Phytophthora ramorum]
MSTQPDRAPEPDAAILGDTYDRGQWKLAAQVYNAVLVAVVVVALVLLLVVKAGVVNVGDGDAQDDWSEVSSQVITGVFTWVSITALPAHICGVTRTSRVLKTSRDFCNERLWSSICAARYLNDKFPLTFIDTRTTVVNNGDTFEEGRCDPTVYVDSQAKKQVVGCFGNIVFLRNDAKHLRSTFLLLSCGCFLQFVMTGYMWGYDASSRPGFVLPGLLPPIILCNGVGQYRLSQLNKRSKKRRVTPEEAPIAGELSSPRNSLSSV